VQIKIEQFFLLLFFLIMGLKGFNGKVYSRLWKFVNNSGKMLKNTKVYLLCQEISMSNLAIPFLKNVLEHNRKIIKNTIKPA